MQRVARLLHGRRHAVADAVQRVEPGPLLQQDRVHARPVSTPRSRRRRSTRSRPTRRRSSTPGAAPHGFGAQARPVVLEQWIGEGGQALRQQRERPRDARDRRSRSTTTPASTSSRGSRTCTSRAWPRTPAGPKATSTTTSAIGNKAVGMTIDTSAALGTISQVLASRSVRRRRARRRADARPAGRRRRARRRRRALHREAVVARRSEAAWRLRQVPRRPRDAGRSGPQHRLHPDPASRRSTCPRSSSSGRRSPCYKVAYDQLATDNTTVAAKGPVIGDFPGVRKARDRRDGGDVHQRDLARGRARSTRPTNSNKAITRLQRTRRRRRLAGVRYTRDDDARTRWRRARRCGRARRARRRPGAAPASPRSWCTSSTT